MYPLSQTTRDPATSERRPTTAGLDRDSFRPVALPALAAAVHAAGKPASRKAGPAGMSCPEMSARFLHEDAPLV